MYSGNVWLKICLTPLLDFCFPALCPGCHSQLVQAKGICFSCEEALGELMACAGCPRCGAPVFMPGAPCPFCQGRGIRPLERIVRLGTYDDPLKELIHQLKYHRRWGLADRLADRLLAREEVRALLAETDVLVPIPLHPLRHLYRGYNQSELIARRMARQAQIRLAKPLVRRRNTPSQTQLTSRAARAANLRDAFGLLDERSVHQQRVMLVDDVMTTGATARSAARTLLEARPRSIGLIVLGVADPKGRGFERI